ncbi:gene transfer agent family protein [Agrobacterium rhizogenes]|uniref:gene transfer agent family protein n=1 Tax=Rhizobium rhizogenes TaxID=359 RepID=UPI0022B67532|nr:gene transfer agent family protein [Rhizobium rhizogenes]MCZ7451034.1 gene transfer agent family protein [Rhizobium rhizogenes]
MRSARIELDWGDGTYTFRLAWGQLIELQEKCDAGPYVILQRLQTGAWQIEDISNVIRLGLIGGGMTAVDALKKTRAYVEAFPPMDNLLPAQGILAAALMGAPDEAVGEADAAIPKENSSTLSQTES